MSRRFRGVGGMLNESSEDWKKVRQINALHAARQGWRLRVITPEGDEITFKPTKSGKGPFYIRIEGQKGGWQGPVEFRDPHLLLNTEVETDHPGFRSFDIKHLYVLSR